MQRPTAVMAAFALALGSMGIAACGGDDDDDNGTAAAPATTETQPAETTPAEPAGEATLAELAADTPTLSTLVTAVTAADLVETLSGEGPFTVFAPDNAAFEKVDEATLEDLLEPENKDQLTSVLTYHVVPGELKAADLSDGQELETVQGEKLTVSIDGDTVKINDATVTLPDVAASNGVAHVIDTVLLPPS